MQIQVRNQPVISPKKIKYDFPILPKLVVGKDHRVFLLGEVKNEIHLAPLVKALYVLYLKHVEGISFYDLSLFQNELLEIYLSFTNRLDFQTSLQNIKRLTNRVDNSIHEKCSRVKEAFKLYIPDSQLNTYIISGKKKETKKIPLDRNFVIWE